MMQPEHYSVVAIPLSREEVVDFLMPPSDEPRGAEMFVVDQRPSHSAKAAWIQHLRGMEAPTIEDLLLIDDPHGHLKRTSTDRLVPVEFLQEDPEYLTRNLGGWAPIYFGVVGLPDKLPSDPLFGIMEVLAEYGKRIQAFAADPGQVAARLDGETGATVKEVAAALIRLYEMRRGLPITDYIERISNEILTGNYMATDPEPPVPDLLLLDELMRQLVRLERARRRAVANGQMVEAETIQAWQEAQAAAGLKLILKGEYIMGRHRSSTIIIAETLGTVIKQPAPEPFHEIKLEARTHNGRAENWPYLTHDGSLVTSRGRIRLVLEENLVPRLNRAFNHAVRFSTLLGLIVEEFVRGETVQDAVQRDPRLLTPDLYDVFILHQQTCEALGIENGDWHSANFIVREGTGDFVHIDWGAARPLRPEEYTEEARQARLNQVQNLGFSFHDEALAERTRELHEELMQDEERLARIRQRANAYAARV